MNAEIKTQKTTQGKTAKSKLYIFEALIFDENSGEIKTIRRIGENEVQVRFHLLKALDCWLNKGWSLIRVKKHVYEF